jgi:hypothetical protein
MWKDRDGLTRDVLDAEKNYFILARGWEPASHLSLCFVVIFSKPF